MWRTLKHFLLFALHLAGFALNLMLLVHCQDDRSGRKRSKEEDRILDEYSLGMKIAPTNWRLH
ncbi:unnamed protein product [Prunus brigantina]